MAYTVLARKYRSQTFEDVVGQEPIATTLVNAITAGRIHHGYLFTGTRGVGKTSMARILAKAMNCQSQPEPTTKPCCQCDACRAIAEGQDIDVIEIDAASNTGVDNIRELRSNATYKPSREHSRKVYIIDEVHMLSTGAFNALLKTLEEPPEHVMFILATTEIQKVPATIQSRCQCFRFRNIGPEPIAKRLLEIAAAEGATMEDPAAQRVARLANGSMRDALSILDQLLAVSSERVDLAMLDEILPPAHDERIVSLLQQASRGDAAAVLTELDGLLAGGRGLENFCNDAIEVVRTLMLVRTCGVDASLVDIPAGRETVYGELAKGFTLSQYVQMIAMLEELRRNVRYSGAGRALTEALMVRFAHMRDWASIEQLAGQLAGGGGGADQKKKSPAALLAAREAPEAPVRPPPPAPPARPAPSAGRSQAAPASPLATDLAPVDVYDDVDTGEAGGSLDEDAEPPARNTGVRRRREVSHAERAEIERDPVVQKTLELFDGLVISMEREEPAAQPPAEPE